MRGYFPGYEQEVGRVNHQTDDDANLLRDREYTCPVCGMSFKAKMPRAGRLVSEGSDGDLRPRFKNLDVIKYQVIKCPACRYADVEKDFSAAMRREIEAYKREGPERIDDASSIVGPQDYRSALETYRDALKSAKICGRKKGKLAYTELCTAWLLRGWRESELDLPPQNQSGECRREEEERYLADAAEHFMEAERTEDFPICGLNRDSLNCIMARILFWLGRKELALMYLTDALRSNTLNPRHRVMMEDLRDEMRR